MGIHDMDCFSTLSVARLVVSKNCDESSRNFLVEFILEKKI